MPTYEYECKSCGNVFDVFHSMTAKPRIKCPECGGRTRKRIGAGAGIIFKGSGFYETDYKRKTNPEKPEGAAAGSESKPEPKKEEKKSEKSEKPKED